MPPSPPASPAQNGAVQALLETWRHILGSDGISTSPNDLRNAMIDIGQFTPRSVVALLYPRSTAQVQAIVRANLASPTKLPLFTISTGRNWGLGKAPMENGGVLIDLKFMRAIDQLDTSRGVAVVQPAVTLMDLAKALRGEPWFINVTASCGETSVVGNALDRGVGFARQRTEDILGLEVVLGTGEVIRVGSFWHLTDEPTFHYRHGVGPDMLPLFMQSGFGIVTRAAVSLLPRPERLKLFEAKFHWNNLVPAIDALAALYRQGLFNSVFKIYDTDALRNYGMSEDGKEISGGIFQCLGSLHGRADIVETAQRVAERDLHASGAYTSTQFIETGGEDHPYFQMTIDRFAGLPTCKGHQTTFGPSCDLDIVAEQGWLFFLPVVPFEGSHVRRALCMLQEVGREVGHPIGCTINTLTARCVDMVVSIHFKKTPEGTAIAHRALARLHEKFRACGYFSYREDVDHQALVGPPEYLRTVAKLKDVFDPNGIIAPGRYSATGSSQDSDGNGQGAPVAGSALPESLEEVHVLATKKLHPLVDGYFNYSADQGTTYHETRRAFKRLRIRPSILRDMRNIDLSVTVLGQRLAHPIMIAPFAFHGMLHPDAELATAKAARATGALYTVNGFLSNTPLATVTAAGGPQWLHVYIFKERDITADLVRRAQSLGFKAIVVTCDHPTTRITDVWVPKFANTTRPLPEIKLPNLDPNWVSGDPLRGTNDAGLVWEDIAWLKTLTSLPVIVKGVLTPDDARLAVKHGASAIIVSNHGGRQVDGQPPAIEVLPSIVSSVPGQVEVYLDSGIRYGGDVLRALALGARAVLVGRPIAWGLAWAGEDGVRFVLEYLRDNLQADMAHVGCTRIQDISSEILLPTAKL